MSHTIYCDDPASLKEIKTPYYGYDLLLDPLLNKGTAFTEEERNDFELHGLLPASVANIEDQIKRRIDALGSLETDLEKYAFLRELQDNNETLFYTLLTRNLEELMPIVYTPTVGAGCQHFSRLFRKPRGLYLSYPQRDRIKQILSNPRFNQVEVIVVTDGERILGLGDLGAGGMGIPIGKLSLYTACAGIHPATTLPIFLDVGTNNRSCLLDPIYIGWRHERITDQKYDEFIDIFIDAFTTRFPHVLLQWEDFAKNNATRVLNRYRDKICTFNDDIQGTAAVAAGTLLATFHITNIPIIQLRMAIVGAGSAGIGIAHLWRKILVEAGLSDKQALDNILLIDRTGLLMDKQDLLPFQKPFAKGRDFISHWKCKNPGEITLMDILNNFKPNALIGVSGQSGAFTQEIIQKMAANHDRPIIFPLSNPTANAEATPIEIDQWTEGRAIISTGSPFPPIIKNGIKHNIDQTNNSYIFPGVGLGSIAIRAKHINDAMFIAAAKALAAASPASLNPNNNLLPPITEIRAISYQVAMAVAKQAREDDICMRSNSTLSDEEIENYIKCKIWQPRYLPYHRIDKS